MELRNAIRVIHPLAGIIAFAVILLFQLGTLGAELFGDGAAVAQVKADIVAGLFILAPALALAGATGVFLAGAHPAGLAAKKLGRMKIIAPNGLLVLIPAALFLNWKAGAGEFDSAFYAAQIIELTAGLANLTLLGLNMRDGLRMTRRWRRARA